jgi:hypothetical protein
MGLVSLVAGALMAVVRLLLLSPTTMTMLLILLLTTLRPMTILSRTFFL